jgi:hypothetical protein
MNRDELVDAMCEAFWCGGDKPPVIPWASVPPDMKQDFVNRMSLVLKAVHDLEEVVGKLS